MKKGLRTIAGICLLLIFALFLTGCISIEMKINKNGSCDLKYEIETEGMIDTKEIEKQFKDSIDEANKNAGKTVAKLKDVKEKDGKVIANISVNHISFIDDEAFLGKYSDLEKKYPNIINELKEAKSGKSVEKGKIKGAGGLNAVRLWGISTGGGDLTKFTLILPGNVKYISSGVTFVDNKTVTLDGGYGVVLYEGGGGGGAGWLVFLLIIAAVVVVVVVLAGKKKKGASQAAYVAAPAAAPVQAGPAAAAPTATAAPAGGSEVMYCPHCGTQQKKGAKFCAACGGQMTQ